MLDWLMAAGADEVMVDQPVNRYNEVQAAKLARVVQQPKPVVKVPSPTAPLPSTSELASSAADCASIEQLAALFRATDIHGLAKSAQSFCFIEHVPGARLLVLGDRPRTDEENEGRVFAGKTEILLRNMLKAIDLFFPGDPGEQVTLANLVPWRPPGNRTPSDIELNLCQPFVLRAIELMQPKLVLALGSLPGKVLANGGNSVAQQRGKWLSIGGVPLRATFHPAELLSYPERKRQAWEDLIEVRKQLDV